MTSNTAVPNDLAAYWMPFTANRAFKAAPRLRAGESTTVSLDDMRAMVRASHGRPKDAQALR